MNDKIRSKSFKHVGRNIWYRMSWRPSGVFPQIDEYLQKVQSTYKFIMSGGHSTSLCLRNDLVEMLSPYPHLDEIKKSYTGSNHYKAEQAIMKVDQQVFASEVPLVYGKHRGIVDFLKVLDLNGVSVLEVGDYKPNAYKEDSAHTQVIYYAWMLKKMFGIDNIFVSYFDERLMYRGLFTREMEMLTDEQLARTE